MRPRTPEVSLTQFHGIFPESVLSHSQRVRHALVLRRRGQPPTVPRSPMKRFSSLRGNKKRKEQDGRTGRRQSEPHGLLGSSRRESQASVPSSLSFCHSRAGKGSKGARRRHRHLCLMLFSPALSPAVIHEGTCRARCKASARTRTGLDSCLISQSVMKH